MAVKTIIIKKAELYDGPFRVIVTVCPNCGHRLMIGMTKCPACGTIVITLLVESLLSSCHPSVE